MLDFGSRMPAAPERGGEDDLFSVLPEENAGENSGESAGVELSVAGNTAEQSIDVVDAVSEKSCENIEKKAVSAPEVAPSRSAPFFRGKRRADAEIEREKLETSEVLKAARKRAGLTPEDVENETQIRVRFLMALEDGYFDELPQQVYVLAYLRKLCSLYKISQADEEELVRPWRQVPREVPENLPGTIIPDENSENRKILHRVEIFLLAVIAIVVIGVLAFLVILGVSFLNRHKVDDHFDVSSLLELQEKPRLTAPGVAPVKE